MFCKIAFSIVFSCKIYPEILDFRFFVLYLCGVIRKTFLTILFVIQTTEGRKDLDNIHVDVHEILRRNAPLNDN